MHIPAVSPLQSSDLRAVERVPQAKANDRPEHVHGADPAAPAEQGHVGPEGATRVFLSAQARL